MGAAKSVCVGSWEGRTVQSMSGSLKSPASQMFLSVFMRERDVSGLCRYSVLVEGGL